jgi:hypothetical protein
MVSVLASAGVVAIAGEARAVDVPDVGGETLTLDVTNTAIGGYAFDNRDDSAATLPAPSAIVNDTFGYFTDRLNVQAYYWRFRLGLRLDGLAYFAQLDDQDLADIAKERLPDASGSERYDYENEFRRELHTRYRNTLYPAKLFLGYTAPNVDVTVGDFYAQFGRGLVLSVRKQDELAVDTTVRGLKASFKKSWEDASLAVTALAGQMNPIRVDDQTGRRLNGAGSPLFFGFPTADDFTFYHFDESGRSGYTTVPARPSYLEDAIFGLSAEAGPTFLLFGAHGTVLKRPSHAEDYLRCRATDNDDCESLYPTFATTNPSRLRDTIITASGSLNAPNILDHGDAYLEVAGQEAMDGRPTAIDGDGFTRVENNTGYAIYFAGNLRAGPVTVNLEGKHYHSFLPLSGTINANGAADGTFAAPEFDTVAYNQPPTAEPIYAQVIGSPNVCVTGGRARVDYRVAKDLAVYGWAGYFTSLTESNAANVSCDASNPQERTNTVDAASGADLSFKDGYVKAWIGLRDARRGEPSIGANLADASDAFYSEGYIRYDVSLHLGGDFTLQSQGFHRHRFEPDLRSDSWNEGENYLALRWAPHLAFIFGYEYLGRSGCTPDASVLLCHYFNGAIQFKGSDRDDPAQQIFDTVSLFVGQQRGAIRCVSGVCRNFPPFEGARLELTSRF